MGGIKNQNRESKKSFSSLSGVIDLITTSIKYKSPDENRNEIHKNIILFVKRIPQNWYRIEKKNVKFYVSNRV